MTRSTPESLVVPCVSASGTLTLANRLLNHHGARQADIEAVLGTTLTALQDPDCRLPAERHYALWHFALTASDDPALGLHLGQIVEPDRMGLVGHILFNSDTLGHALREYTRLHRLVNEAVDIRLETVGDSAVLTWGCDLEDDYCIADMERTVSSAVARARHFIHPRLHIESLAFAHPEPAYREEYEKIFECPLTFGAEETQLTFASHYLDWRLPQRNPYLYRALLNQVNGLLARLQSRKAFSRRVRRLIARQLSSEQLDADHIARQLHMSRQTLYRKLKQEGEGFQGLVESVRQQRALRHVSEDSYALSEIAFLLGFSELSAFSRAFKRWTGESPGQYRERHRQNSDN